MQTVYFQELKYYSKSKILEEIKNDEKAFDKLLKHAIISKDEDLYQFKFVGVIIIDNLVVNCYPKYIPSDINPENDFKQVIKVIKKYNNLYDDLDYQNENLEDIFVHYSAIIKDGYKTLKEGAVVNFKLIETSKGLQAIDVIEEVLTTI